MKILSEPCGDIPAMDLKEGEIAVITNWSITAHEHVGAIVKRYRYDLIKLSGADTWTGFYSGDKTTPNMSKCRVRILPKGTVIEL